MTRRTMSGRSTTIIINIGTVFIYLFYFSIFIYLFCCCIVYNYYYIAQVSSTVIVTQNTNIL